MTVPRIVACYCLLANTLYCSNNCAILLRVAIICFLLPAVSIISSIIIIILFFSEFAYYLQTEVTPQLYVDNSRGEKLRINLDIVFPDLPCGCASSSSSWLAIPGVKERDTQLKNLLLHIKSSKCSFFGQT